MFDLDREIEAWCREIVACQCARAANLEELKDHLHCLVEEHIEQGAGEAEAFVAALKQMGERELIAQAYAENKTLLQKVAAYDRGLQRALTSRFSVKQLAWFVLGYSLLCAGLMIGAALAVEPANKSMVVNWMLVVWFVPFIVIAADPGLRKAECALFRKVLNRAL